MSSAMAVETHEHAIRAERARSPRRENASSTTGGALFYHQVDLSTWKSKVPPGKNAFGNALILLSDECTGESPKFRLYRRGDDECSHVVFPIEFRDSFGPNVEKPAFLGGTSTRKVESLEIQLSITPTQIAFFKQIDEWMKQEAFDQAKAWFGRVYTKEEIDVMYQSPLRVDPQGRWDPSVKARLNLSGVTKFLTNVRLVKPDGGFVDGAGWPFVSSHLGDHKWRGNKVCAVVDVRRVWYASRRFGLNISVTDLKVWQSDVNKISVFDLEVEEAV